MLSIDVNVDEINENTYQQQNQKNLNDTLEHNNDVNDVNQMIEMSQISDKNDDDYMCNDLEEENKNKIAKRV